MIDLKERQFATQEQKTVLRALAESVARPGCRFLEVGSWCGDSTVILGNVAKENGGHVFCVDWWKGNIGTELASIAAKHDVFSHFWKRMELEALQDIVIPIRGNSHHVSEVLKENTFDLLFIDGDHRYEAALDDIRRYRPLVRREKGILCGDDCEGYLRDFDRDFLEEGKGQDVHETVHCGVVLAVGSLFKEYSIHYGIWSVLSAALGSWKKVSLSLPGIPGKKQLDPNPLGFTEQYCFYRYGRWVYAVPRAWLDFDIASQSNRQRKGILRAISVEELEKIAGETICAKGVPLLTTSYKGWNIVEYDHHFYAVSQALGPLDLTKEEERNRPEVLVAESHEEIERGVDAKLAQEKIPILLDSYEGYNLVQYGPKTYAILKTLGELELSDEKDRRSLARYIKNNKCFAGDSIEEVKHCIEAKTSHSTFSIK